MKKLIYCLKSIEECSKLESELPSHILEHCRKYSDERSSVSFFGYRLLGYLLNKLGKSINSLSFSNNGKPLLIDGFVSISHSRVMIMVSISEIEHGIDIQYDDLTLDLDRIIKKYFPSNYSKYSLLNDERKRKLFYSLWVKKESFTKCYDRNILDYSEYDYDSENVKVINSKINNYYIGVCSKEEVEIEVL